MGCLNGQLGAIALAAVAIAGLELAVVTRFGSEAAYISGYVTVGVGVGIGFAVGGGLAHDALAGPRERL